DATGTVGESDSGGTSSPGDAGSGEAGDDEGGTTGAAVDDDAGSEEGDAGTSSGGGDPTAGGSSTGDVEAGTQPAFGEYSHCLSNAACNVGSCMTLGNPVSDGFCALTCGAGGNPAPCGAPPLGSPLSTTCYGADNGAGGAAYVCALGCEDDQPCPDGMECFSVPQAAAAGGGNVEFCA
ncbi:MAG: hypothetical protein AAF721_35705, partial [Myxococcota bacterium]